MGLGTSLEQPHKAKFARVLVRCDRMSFWASLENLRTVMPEKFKKTPQTRTCRIGRNKQTLQQTNTLASCAVIMSCRSHGPYPLSLLRPPSLPKPSIFHLKQATQANSNLSNPLHTRWPEKLLPSQQLSHKGPLGAVRRELPGARPYSAGLFQRALPLFCLCLICTLLLLLILSEILSCSSNFLWTLTAREHCCYV